MKEITISTNDANQRIDRFLKKYMDNATKGFLYKMLRKKRIKLNNLKANPEDILNEGDKIQLYLAEETINKFKGDKNIENVKITFDVIYEDDNILLMNKPKGLLSHSATEEDNNTVVKQLLSYLYNTNKYNPEDEKTFVPSICNRLDRNTSGIIIGGKNHTSLQIINDAISRGSIKKYYKCLVAGELKEDKILKGYLIKNPKDNTVNVSNNRVKNSKEIETHIKVLKTNREYSLLEIDLITGRTHQIRAHLASIGYPIIGDIKYGDRNINEKFKKKYNLNSQFLHAYKITFNDLTKPLDYLNGQSFIGEMDDKMKNIENKLFS